MRSERSMNKFYYSVSIISPSLITIITLILQLSADPLDSSFIHPKLVHYMFMKIQINFLLQYWSVQLLSAWRTSTPVLLFSPGCHYSPWCQLFTFLYDDLCPHPGSLETLQGKNKMWMNGKLFQNFELTLLLFFLGTNQNAPFNVMPSNLQNLC